VLGKYTANYNLVRHLHFQHRVGKELSLCHGPSVGRGRRVLTRYAFRYNIKDVVRDRIDSITVHLCVDCREFVLFIFVSVAAVCYGAEDEEDASSDSTYDDSC
jgi:hypothetical protein